MAKDLIHYASLLDDIKARIRGAQTRATFAANRELIGLYWEIGGVIVARQQSAGWGAGVLRRLAVDLKSQLPGIRGYPERNLKRMTQFFRAYPELVANGPRPVAHLDPGELGSQKGPPAVAHLPEAEKVRHLVAQLPWAHNMLLLQKVKDLAPRLWYMEQTLSEGWSRDVLGLMIKSCAHQRAGQATTNFAERLPSEQSDLVRQSLKDPYIFDFLTLDKPFRERELEAGLVAHLERFLLELGAGFAFVGRQYHLAIGEDDFYLDLLFYHLKLRCFVVVDLKVGAFKPDHAGKMNFYLNVVDDTLRHENDKPSIGLILCQDKKTILAEYALRGMDKPIGVSEYELTRALPSELASELPSIDEIEAELSAGEETNDGE